LTWLAPAKTNTYAAKETCGAEFRLVKSFILSLAFVFAMLRYDEGDL